MPPVKDKIERNVKDIYINPKDYIKYVSESAEEDQPSCAGCKTGRCYYCNDKRSTGASNFARQEIDKLFN